MISLLPTAHSHLSDHVPAVSFIFTRVSAHPAMGLNAEPFHLPHAPGSAALSPAGPLVLTLYTALHSSSVRFELRGNMSTLTLPAGTAGRDPPGTIALLVFAFCSPPSSKRTTTTSDAADEENGFVASLNWKTNASVLAAPPWSCAPPPSRLEEITTADGRARPCGSCWLRPVASCPACPAATSYALSSTVAAPPPPPPSPPLPLLCVILARVNEMERTTMLVDGADLFVARATASTVEATDCRSILLPPEPEAPPSPSSPPAVVRSTEEDASNRAVDVAVVRSVFASAAPLITEATTWVVLARISLPSLDEIPALLLLVPSPSVPNTDLLRIVATWPRRSAVLLGRDATLSRFETTSSEMSVASVLPVVLVVTESSMSSRVSSASVISLAPSWAAKVLFSAFIFSETLSVVQGAPAHSVAYGVVLNTVFVFQASTIRRLLQLVNAEAPSNKSFKQTDDSLTVLLDDTRIREETHCPHVPAVVII